MSRAMRKCVLCHANNKGADQPAHPRSLISDFVVRCLDSIISPHSIAEISRLKLASVAAQAGLCLAESETPEDTFCRVVAHMFGIRAKYAILLWRVKQICVFEHSVMINFNCACPAIQRGQRSGFLSQGSS